YASRIGHQLWSTELRSTRYRSYISSTSHSLAPNSPEFPSSGTVPVTGFDTAESPTLVSGLIAPVQLIHSAWGTRGSRSFARPEKPRFLPVAWRYALLDARAPA